MSRASIWDFWAKHYEQLWVQKYSLGPTRREIVRFLTEKLKAEQEYHILDVGCATGQLLREIKTSFPTYKLKLFGFDYSQAMIEQAKAQGDSISYQQRDVRDIEDLGKKFDFIICTHSFPYYEDQTAAISGFSNILNQAGYLLLAQASQNNLYDRIVMSVVKMTTGSANYPSVKAFLNLTDRLFTCESIVRIRERFYMPSIYFFALTKRDISTRRSQE